jgi:nucleoside-diphosphate-sugar epimerase
MSTICLAPDDKIVLFGAAGLVGQNLALLLREAGYRNIVGIDKHPVNVGILRRLGTVDTVIEADMAVPGPWQDALAGAKICVMLQAQIGGEIHAEYVANNVTSTEHALDAIRRHQVPYFVHISSSVVNSLAVDFYTETKEAQEKLVVESGLSHCILRPTLMFGWFDRKHLGWLSRFMKKIPVFPIPGSGRYLRQPLFVEDFCRIIMRCMEMQPAGDIYNISGRERVDYIDIIRMIKQATGASAPVVNIPYRLFWLMLKAYSLVNGNPPFTTKQLAALSIPEEFELIPWWDIFGVKPTPFAQAVERTFKHPKYSSIVLDF